MPSRKTKSLKPAEISISDWREAPDAVAEAHKILEFEPSDTCFYRGQGAVDWQLLPSLHRAEWRRPRDLDLMGLERSLFWEFKCRSADMHTLPMSDWDHLAEMQHFGIPTRLLDWTELFGVAVYFALCDLKPDSACDAAVWMLNPGRLNSHKDSWSTNDVVAPEFLAAEYGDYGAMLDRNVIPWKRPIAIYPLQKTSRMRMQRAWFTVHGSIGKPLDEICPEALVKIVLPASTHDDARRFLEFSGLTESIIFPGIEGLAMELVKKYIK